MRRCSTKSMTVFRPAASAALARALPPAAVCQMKFSSDLPHFRKSNTKHPLYEKPSRFHTEPKVWDNPMKHRIWSHDEVMGVQQTHLPTKDIVDKIALFAIKVMRQVFDIISGYKIGRVTERKILRRILFLETAAGIPGMVAGSVRHLRSLRLMKRDHGWIHTLLEEAENERMHMLTFMDQYQPGLFFRSCVLVTQGVFWNVFFFTYLACPRLCHRFVGYLEEEATRTYSHIIELLESSDPANKDLVAFGKKPANDISKRYWQLPDDATILDVIYAVRADEANHRDVNHTLASIQADDTNPFVNEEKHKKD